MTSAPTGFLSAWNHLLGSFVPRVPKRPGRPARVPLTQLLAALTFHFMNGAGTLAEHFFQLFDQPFADSSWSDRRSRLPWEAFTDLMRRALRPRATRRQRQSSWRQWRLVALDGTQLSLTNTPQIKQHSAKARSRRGRAAFAKLWTVVLLEVGLHNPLAACIGRRGQSEWELACGLLAQLPRQALLLADRLYGCAGFVAQALPACQRVGSQFLFRVRSNIQAKTLRRHKDGSRLVRVGLRHKNNPNRIVQWLEVREIQVQVARPGFPPQTVRLWTSLLNWKEAPAQELARLYTQRWEHELYYREIKRPPPMTVFPPSNSRKALPLSQTVNIGANVTFTVVASSPGNLTYAWRHGSKPIPDATDSSLTLTNVQIADAGEYVVAIHRTGQPVEAPPAILTVGGVSVQDLIGPVIDVTAPLGNFAWVYGDQFMFNGTANDDTGVIGIYYQQDDNPWRS